MSPRQGKDWLRRVVALAAAVAAVTLLPAVAFADEVAVPTTQATAYNADWVPYLDPPAKPAAVCLVDSGVNITPDTPVDSPEGPIVKRLSLDGGPGTAASDTWEGLHGTRMAFVGSAPINGWGAVGFWPGARVISIRAMPTNASGFPFDDYSRAILLCSKQTAMNIAAVNLSLGCDCVPTAKERTRLDLQIANAHENGASVVAAAGNSAGAVDMPADEPGVFAVAASDNSGELCSFSNRGAGVDILASGCGIDLADPNSGQPWSGYQSGTSGASMTTSIVLALLRSYRPDLGWQAAEQLVTHSGRPTTEGSVLDVEGVFRAAGIGWLVDAAKARTPMHTAPTSAAVPAPAPADANSGTSGATPDDFTGNALDGWASTHTALATPRMQAVRRRGARLSVIVRNLPPGARLAVQLQSRRSEFSYATVARATRSSSRITLRLPRHWRGGRLVVRYETATGPRRPSAAVYRRVP